MSRNLIVMDADTGEYVDDVIVKSIDDIERQRDFFERREKYYEYKNNYTEYGSFTWFIYEPGLNLSLNISSKHLFRLFYLATYIDYNGVLRTSKRKNMDKNSMLELIGGTRSNFYLFYGDLKKARILIERKDKLYLNSKYFKKGKLDSTNNGSNDKLAIKISHNVIRGLYNKSEVNDNKSISYAFQLIPYIDVNTNNVCYNPIKDKKPMSLDDICNLLGHSLQNKRKLKSNLSKVRIKNQPIIFFIGRGKNIVCYVNPQFVCATKNINDIYDIIQKNSFNLQN